jgi:TP901-1 family phage major tail protein
MSKVAGVDVLLKVKEKETGDLIVVGGQTGASLTRSATTIDVSDKLSGAWASSLAGMKSFTIDADGFVSLGDKGQELIEQAFENREKVFIEIRVGDDTDAEGVTYTGACVITELSNEFSQEDAVTFSISLEGASPLVRTVGAVTGGSTGE